MLDIKKSIIQGNILKNSKIFKRYTKYSIIDQTLYYLFNFFLYRINIFIFYIIHDDSLL